MIAETVHAAGNGAGKAPRKRSAKNMSAIWRCIISAARLRATHAMGAASGRHGDWAPIVVSLKTGRLEVVM